MAITRTPIVDDDLTGGFGTVFDDAWKQELYNQIDAEFDAKAPAPGTSGYVLTSNGAGVPPTYQASGGGGAFTVATTSTLTGAQNNWAPGLSGNTFIPWNGASDAAFTGLAGGVAGQVAVVKNITAAKVATFAHNSGSSSAGNKFKNLVTSAPTPIASGGWIIYQYDGTDWQLTTHEQGALITPTFSAGIFTASAGTWTVDSGDISVFAYKVSGRMYTLTYQINTTSVSTTPASLIIAFPGGFTGAKTAWYYVYNEDNGTVVQSKAVISGTTVDISKTSGNWSAATNNTRVTGTVTGEIT